MESLKAILWAILAALVWGSAPVFFKLGLKGEISPLSGIFFHNLTATIFALLTLLILKENPLSYTFKEIFFVSLGGFVSGFLGLLVYYKAVKAGEVSIVAPIASSSPLFSTLLAVLILGEEFTVKKFVGTILIVLGIILVSYSKS